MSFAIIVMLLGSATAGIANALLVPVEEHWKYNVKWRWDADLRKNIGMITPLIVIENETSDRLEGYIADANGTRLMIYDGQQVVMSKFMFDSGLVSRWEIVDRIHDGYFAIDIPEKYSKAETVRIYIGNFQYTVDSKPQVWVFINSATMNYRTNSTLDGLVLPETSIASKQKIAIPLDPCASVGSLIDRILCQYELESSNSSNIRSVRAAIGTSLLQTPV
jgi:hypothetical protein